MQALSDTTLSPEAAALRTRLLDVLAHTCLHLADRLARGEAVSGIGNSQEGGERDAHSPNVSRGGLQGDVPAGGDGWAEDSLALWRQAEQAQAMSEDRTLPVSIRRAWHEHMDLIQECERERLVLLQRTAESHDRAVGEAPSPRCREYTATEIGYDSLMQLCRKRCRKASEQPPAA